MRPIPLGQLYVSQFRSSPGGVVLGSLGELLGDDQLGNVNPVAQQVRDGLLIIEQCLLGGSERET